VLFRSTAFAGSLLKLCGLEGGGIHLVGDSSTGKTTALQAACSVWGGSDYKRSWNTTANGLEGVASLCNDRLLALDEISECDPKYVGDIVYQISNGVGKARATKTGTARAVTDWRVFSLSTGERTISTSMEMAKEETKEGQKIRMLDIPVESSYGAWDELHGLATGTEFSDAIKKAAQNYYGTSGRAFLEKLTADIGRNFHAALEGYKQQFLDATAEGQHSRAATRFAVVALAGELATEYGITGWNTGDAVLACKAMFKRWTKANSKTNGERIAILQKLADYIDTKGASHFAKVDADTFIADSNKQAYEQSGWKEDHFLNGYIYYFNSAAFKDALSGHDFDRAHSLLVDEGVVQKAGKDGKKSICKKIAGTNYRVFPVFYNVLIDRLEYI